MVSPITLYDLVPQPGGTFMTPNPPKARFSLLHKGVAFETREVTWMGLKALGKRMGVERPTGVHSLPPFFLSFLRLTLFAPGCQFPPSSFQTGPFFLIRGRSPSEQLDAQTRTWRHLRCASSRWLEANYPDAPSLFLPDVPTPIDPASPALRFAKNAALLFSEGFGSSDAQWSTFFELSAPGMAALMEEGSETDKEPHLQDWNYFVSDAKLGMKDGYKTLTSLDKKALAAHAKASLLPLEAVLKRTPFLAGEHPGFIDYVAIGRYFMMRSADPALCRAIWRRGEIPEVEKWIERIQGKWAAELKDLLERLPAE
ncbi:SPOSA6832_03682 [Sporobolomyces salmonicolor]|uniref:SPOSA6832_03682-mRNA-1:cds n=1 Tax=Sporidiobolus salmonicolor TaxID=5005 RepID=A0A0D6EQT2_SPOSA|nr:SPOSA6832_03682 [Sporobolomyces salmonicolor]